MSHRQRMLRMDCGIDLQPGSHQLGSNRGPPKINQFVWFKDQSFQYKVSMKPIRHISKTVYENYETAGKNNKTSFRRNDLVPQIKPDHPSISITHHPQVASRPQDLTCTFSFRCRGASKPGKPHGRVTTEATGFYATHLETQFIHMGSHVYICLYLFIFKFVCNYIWTIMNRCIHIYISLYLYISKF